MSSPSSCPRMPSIMVMVPLLRNMDDAYLKCVPVRLAAAQHLYARTSAKWSLQPPAPCARFCFARVAARLASASIGNTHGSLRQKMPL